MASGWLEFIGVTACRVRGSRGLPYSTSRVELLTMLSNPSIPYQRPFAAEFARRLAEPRRFIHAVVASDFSMKIILD
jgi:hypothetical protein